MKESIPAQTTAVIIFSRVSARVFRVRECKPIISEHVYRKHSTIILQVIVIAQFIANTMTTEIFQRKFKTRRVRWNCQWNEYVLGGNFFVVANSTEFNEKIFLFQI